MLLHLATFCCINLSLGICLLTKIFLIMLDMLPTSKKLDVRSWTGILLWACLSVRLFVHRPSVRFGTFNISGTMYDRILKFHICINYEKLADSYCSFLSDSSRKLYAPFHTQAF